MSPLILACYHHSLDAQVATSMPFMHSWTMLFWLFTTVFGFVLAVEARAAGGRAPLKFWKYVALAIVTAPFTMGFTGQLFLILPFLVFNAGWVLGSGDGTRTFRAVTRATLVAMVVLVPVSYLRLRWQLGPLGFAYVGFSVATVLIHSAAAITAVLGVASLGHAAGRRAGLREEPRSLPAGWPRRLNNETQRVQRAPVAVQAHQSCPMCRDLVVSPGREDVLAYCPDCHTVLHRDCADELGYCPTLACRRRVAKKSPRTLPVDRLLTITARPRLTPELAAVA